MINQMHVYVNTIMWDPTTVDDYVHQINCAKSQNIILNFANEGLPIDLWLVSYRRLISSIDSAKKAKIFVVIDDHYTSHDIERLKIAGVTDVLTIDFFAYFVVCHHNQKRQTSWNIHAGDFLYLNGRDKPERFWLLHQMCKNPARMSKAIYSYHPDQILEHKHVKDYAINHNVDVNDEFTLDYYKNFQKQWIHNLDPVGRDWSRRSRFDSSWFEQTLFSLVVETNLNNLPPAYITEKTYLPIINCRPFLIFGDVGSLAMLKRRGFETFETLLVGQSYDHEQNIQEKIQTIVDNVDHWLTNLKKNSDFVIWAVSHNYDVLCSNVNKMHNKIGSFIARHGLHPNPEFTVPSGPWYIDLNWNIFYKNIKDPQWPSCDLLSQFDMLPSKIQDECLRDPWCLPFLRECQIDYLGLPERFRQQLDAH